jgi:hypothetical protein
MGAPTLPTAQPLMNYGAFAVGFDSHPSENIRTNDELSPGQIASVVVLGCISVAVIYTAVVHW